MKSTFKVRVLTKKRKPEIRGGNKTKKQRGKPKKQILTFWF